MYLLLRRDLRCSLHDNDGRLYYQVEDLASGRFYRLGVPECTLACHLDGTKTLVDVVAQLQGTGRTAALTVEDAESTARWLLTSGLAVPVGANGQILGSDAKRIAPSALPVSLNRPLKRSFPVHRVLLAIS